MKFDSFVKYAGSDGTILEAENGDKWLCYDSIAMKIPEGRSVCGKSYSMPIYIEQLIYIYEDYDAAELTDAFVPTPHSKPSELMRKFSGGDLEIDITNKAFGFIEKKDFTYINEVEILEDNGDTKRYKALLVSNDYGDDKEFKMIYLVKEDK